MRLTLIEVSILDIFLSSNGVETLGLPGVVTWVVLQCEWQIATAHQRIEFILLAVFRSD